MRNEFLYKDSEFKKPYRARNYAQMEYSFPTTHWNPPGFDMPANFPATGNNGYPELRSRMFYRFVCEGVKIGYTTGEMLNNETQDLTIENGHRFTTYDWEVSGLNADIFDLSTALQTTDAHGNVSANVFTPKDIAATDFVTIKLLQFGEVCDEIQIYVRCAGGSWQFTHQVINNTCATELAFDELTPCSGKCSGTPFCKDVGTVTISGNTMIIGFSQFGCAHASSCEALCAPTPQSCDGYPPIGYYTYVPIKYVRSYYNWVCP